MLRENVLSKIFYSPPEDMFMDFREREIKRHRERRAERGRETSIEKHQSAYPVQGLNLQPSYVP